eukprot:TRINITY_DN23821_c0_g1_i1.p1 TRINITY_DN23821_c0_g1~~TRINITY_DN23821_c0_g1_i1.p1  ORF type:complete len:184 (+),score=16.33 TRINITY_DN23821_c0_g1_i1:167-718(+)
MRAPSTKRSWADLRQVIDDKRFHELGRDPAGTEHYQQRYQEVKAEWVTVGDMILNREFGFVPDERDIREIDVKDTRTGKRRFIVKVDPSLIEKGKEGIFQTDSGHIYTLKKNDFRYFLDEDIDHYLLWSLSSMPDQEVNNILAKHLDPLIYDTVWFENPPELKSIPNAWHAHVFSKKKEMDIK